MTSKGWQNVAPPIPAIAPKTSRSGNGVVDVVSVSVFTTVVVEVVTEAAYGIQLCRHFWVGLGLFLAANEANFVSSFL